MPTDALLTLGMLKFTSLMAGWPRRSTRLAPEEKEEGNWGRSEVRRRARGLVLTPSRSNGRMADEASLGIEDDSGFRYFM